MATNVLVVDDNRDIREMLQLRLELWGYAVRTASDGQQALDSVAHELPDIVLLDMALPMVDGFQVARTLRSQPASLHLPIIALTALGLPGDKARCLGSGCTDYLAKPFSLDALRGRIEDLVRSSNGKHAA